MTPSELYKLWAPESSIWSNWAKPVLFTARTFLGGEPAQSTDWRSLNIAWAPISPTGTAIIMDLPGDKAVWHGMALGERGFRPVPLYNGVPGPSALVAVNAIILALHEVESTLTDWLARLPDDAPPVFLLDSARRSGGSSPKPGQFDNRWCVFPQDFPSATLLLSRGIGTVILGQIRAAGPDADLAHVLLRWQEAGIKILACAVDEPTPPVLIVVKRPSRFRALWYSALVLAGMRRNSTGGFGSLIPMPSAGGGFG